MRHDRAPDPQRKSKCRICCNAQHDDRLVCCGALGQPFHHTDAAFGIATTEFFESLFVSKSIVSSERFFQVVKFNQNDAFVETVLICPLRFAARQNAPPAAMIAGPANLA
jgi:hypothetical protein